MSGIQATSIDSKLSFPSSVSLASGDDRYRIKVAPELSFRRLGHPFYQTIIRSNTTIGLETFGKVYNHLRQTRVRNFRSRFDGIRICSRIHRNIEKLDSEVVSTYADFTSLIATSFGELYMITHFESPLPSEQYIVRLDLDESTCALTPIDMGRIDWSAHGGLWTPCAGWSPWNTCISVVRSTNRTQKILYCNLVQYETWHDWWGNNSWAAAQVGEFMRYWWCIRTESHDGECTQLVQPVSIWIYFGNFRSERTLEYGYKALCHGKTRE